MADRTTIAEMAEEIREALRPACEVIEIAGGIRRRKPDSHDVELVAVPIFDTNLLGETTDTYSELDAAIAALLTKNMLRWDTNVKRNGPRYKRFISCELDIPVELFLAMRDNFGAIYVIRTGDADFTRLLVTAQPYGCMPDGVLQWGGWLQDQRRETIPTPDEASYFAALGIRSVPEPHTRNRDTALRLARELKERQMEEVHR